MDIQTETAYTIQFTQKEFDILYHGLSMVSQDGLVEAGMSTRESTLFCELFRELYTLYGERK